MFYNATNAQGKNKFLISTGCHPQTIEVLKTRAEPLGIKLIIDNDLSVRVEGHCDERGTREYNLALGEQRAKTVAELLIINGVSSNKISTVSYGEEKPAVSGSNENSWSKNRRALVKTF